MPTIADVSNLQYVRQALNTLGCDTLEQLVAMVVIALIGTGITWKIVKVSCRGANWALSKMKTEPSELASRVIALLDDENAKLERSVFTKQDYRLRCNGIIVDADDKKNITHIYGDDSWDVVPSLESDDMPLIKTAFINAVNRVQTREKDERTQMSLEALPNVKVLRVKSA